MPPEEMTTTIHEKQSAIKPVFINDLMHWFGISRGTIQKWDKNGRLVGFWPAPARQVLGRSGRIYTDDHILAAACYRLFVYPKRSHSVSITQIPNLESTNTFEVKVAISEEDRQEDLTLRLKPTPEAIGWFTNYLQEPITPRPPGRKIEDKAQ